MGYEHLSSLNTKHRSLNTCTRTPVILTIILILSSPDMTSAYLTCPSPLKPIVRPLFMFNKKMSLIGILNEFLLKFAALKSRYEIPHMIDNKLLYIFLLFWTDRQFSGLLPGDQNICHHEHLDPSFFIFASRNIPFMRTVGAKDDCGSALCIRDMAIWGSTWGLIFTLSARNISKAVRSFLYNASTQTCIFRPRPLKHLMLCLNVPFFANPTMLRNAPLRSPTCFTAIASATTS